MAEYDTSSFKLPAPGNFNIMERNGRISLSWSAVSPGELDDGSHGKFGYNIYKDGVLIDWTDKTSYTFTPDNPYGIYKIIATFKSYNDIQSEEAVKNFEKEKEEEPVEPEPETPTTPENPISDIINSIIPTP